MGTADPIKSGPSLGFRTIGFEESGISAEYSISEARKAQQMALDVRRAYQSEQEVRTADVLDRFEMAIQKLPEKRTPEQRALYEQAENHLWPGKQLQEKGGWGYAQIHGCIGIAILEWCL